MRDALDPRAFFPPVSAAVAGDDGSFWLRREGIRGIAARWEAYRPDGELLGGVELPGNLDVVSATSEEVWVVELNELEVPFVVRYAVEGEVR
jgi:hypothetical protein